MIEYKESPSSKFFPGFKSFMIKTSSGIHINGVLAGSGPPILLLHGAPCNLTNWRKVAPKLAENYTVIATDLRGYGDSDMPEGGENHINYSKRVMAQDQVDVMEALGFDRFHVVSHDRGSRVAHRMARDHADKIITATLMDIQPTLYLYNHVDRKFGEAYWFWFFYTVDAPVPETFINNSAEFFMNIGFFGKRKEMISDEAFDNFLRTMKRDGSAHAQCEDYRAASTIDLEHDKADLAKKVSCPVLVLWGEQNPLNKGVDLVSIWEERASNVRGHGCPSAHWLNEQIPDQVIKEVTEFIEKNS